MVGAVAQLEERHFQCCLSQAAMETQIHEHVVLQCVWGMIDWNLSFISLDYIQQ